MYVSSYINCVFCNSALPGVASWLKRLTVMLKITLHLLSFVKDMLSLVKSIPIKNRKEFHNKCNRRAATIYLQ